MCFCVCMHVEAREWHCFFHSLCLGFGDKVYLLKLELADLAPGTLLSLPPRCWDCKHVLPCLTFTCCWDLNLGPSAYPAGALPICPWSKKLWSTTWFKTFWGCKWGGAAFLYSGCFIVCSRPEDVWCLFLCFLCYLPFVTEGATLEAVALLVFLILVGHCINFKTEMWLCLRKMRSSGIFLTNKFYHCNRVW